MHAISGSVNRRVGAQTSAEAIRRSRHFVGILRSLFVRPATGGRARRRPRAGRATLARRLRADAVDCLWVLLRSAAFRNWRFHRQHPLGPFVVDFVCIEQALVIEVRSEPAGEPEADDSRRAFLERLGFRVLKFAASEVLGDLRAVRRAIDQHLRMTGRS
jgi:very-short-patch-repair endonuclease